MTQRTRHQYHCVYLLTSLHTLSIMGIHNTGRLPLLRSHDTSKHRWIYHDDVIKWKHFPRYWSFVRIPIPKASDAELWCFDVFFDLRLNKLLRRQSKRRWIQTVSRYLYDVIVMSVWYVIIVAIKMLLSNSNYSATERPLKAHLLWVLNSWYDNFK